MSSPSSVAPEAAGADIVIRPWRDDADFDACADVLRRATAHDGFTRVRDAVRFRSTFRQFDGDPAHDCWLAVVDGAIAGYAMTFDMGRDDPTTRLLIHNVVVAPAWRGRGVEHRLLDVAIARLRRIVAEAPSPPGVSVRFSSEVSDRETYVLELLRGRGYEADRSLVTMTRPLDGNVPALPLPDTVEVRPVGGPDDAFRVLAALSGAAVEEGLPAFTDTEMAGIVAHPVHGQFEHWQVAWDGPDPVAGVLGWVDAAENQQQGRARAYTERVMTNPAWRRQGIASALLVRAMEHFRAAGLTEAALAVDLDNGSGALGLYERLGFERAATSLIMEQAVAGEGA